MVNIRKFLQGIGLIPVSSTAIDTKGEIEVLDSDGRVYFHDGSAVRKVTANDTTDTLTNKSIDGDDNTIEDLPLTAIKTDLSAASTFLSRDGSGIPISTKAVPTGDVVGTTDSQTLSNKTFTTPVLGSASATKVTFADGSATDPSIGFSSGTSAPSKGFYSAATDTIGLATKDEVRFVFGELPSGGDGAQLVMGDGAAASTIQIRHSNDAGQFNLIGSTGTSAGGQVRLYGDQHATKPNFVEFLKGTSVSAYFNNSQQFIAGNGSASTPSIAFSSSTTAGFYRTSSDQIGWSFGGAAAGRLYGSSGAGTILLGDASTSAVSNIILSGVNDGTVSLSSGTGVSNHGLIVLYGSGHATKANTIELKNNNVIRATINTTQFTSTLPIIIPDGSVSAPGIALTTNNNSGFFRGSGGALSWTVGGVQGGRLTASSIQFGDGTSAENRGISQSVQDGSFVISGDTGSSAGGVALFYGRSHATKANRVEIVNNNTLNFIFNSDGMYVTPLVAFSKNVSTARADVASAATITALSSTTSVVKLTGSTATTIQGIAAGINGQHMWIYGPSGGNVFTLANSNAGASANDQIITLKGTDLSSLIVAHLVYDSSLAKWIVLSVRS